MYVIIKHYYNYNKTYIHGITLLLSGLGFPFN